MLTACVIVWDEEGLLPGCLESLVGRVDRCVVVDGVYADFPHGEGAITSTDRTRAIAEAYGAEWVEAPSQAPTPSPSPGAPQGRRPGEGGKRRAWGDEVEKRNAGLGAVGAGWVLVIDADERLVEGTRYEGSHAAVWRGGELLRPEGGVCVERGVCRLGHLWAMRSAGRQVDKRRYYAKLHRAERGYRREHNI